jgi:signal transduction histidine kinase
VELETMNTPNDLPAFSAADSDYNVKLSRIAELLREPLASIYGFAELLLTQNYDEETRLDLTATLLEQVEVMSNIINSELDARNHQTAAARPQESALTTRRNPGDPA